MRKIKRKRMGFKNLIFIFVISTFILSTGYSLLYETLTVEGKGNIIQNPEEIDSGLLKFTYTTNNWYSSGKNYFQIDGVIENTNEFDVENWKITLYFPYNIEYQAGWNGEYEIYDKKIIITPLNYNNVINSNNSITIGVQVVIPSDFLVIDKVITKGNPVGVNYNPNLFVLDISNEETDESAIDDVEIDENDKLIETNSNISVSANLKAEWQSSNKYVSQYELIIKNDSDSNIEKWEFEIKLPEDVNFSQVWDANYINAEGILKLSNTSYNGIITSNGSVSILIQFESNYQGYIPQIIR